MATSRHPLLWSFIILFALSLPSFSHAETMDFVPKARSKPKNALIAEMRGLTKIILMMRQDIAKLQKQQRDVSALRTQVKALTQQVAQLQQELAQERKRRRQLAKQLPTSPPSTPDSTKPAVPPTSSGSLRVQITGREYAKGFYMLTFTFSRLVDRIEYKLGHMKTFRSTGETHVTNPSTGRGYPKSYIMTRHLKRGLNYVAVRVRDLDGKIIGPYEKTVVIRTKETTDADIFVKYQWTNPIIRQVRHRYYRGVAYFLFFWASQSSIIKRARYSFGSPSLHNDLLLKSNSALLQRTNMEPGKYTLYARFTLVNGYQSPLLTYQVHLKSNGKWYNCSPVE